MFWRRRRSEPRSAEEALAGLRRLGIDRVMLGCGMFGLLLPVKTVVYEYSPGVGLFQPPRSAGEFRFSISSYDMDLYDLRDIRPAIAALGHGEELGPSWADGDGSGDYDDIIGVAADDGPYAEFGGYMMRLFLHENRYLRAIRIACEEPKDLEKAHELLARVFVSQEATPLDLDQPGHDVAKIFVGGYFHMALPDGWTGHGADDIDWDEDGAPVVGSGGGPADGKRAPSPDEEDEEEQGDLFYGLSPDERLLIEVKIVAQQPDESLDDDTIRTMLADHMASELTMMEEEGLPGAVLALNDRYRLIATHGGRLENGRYSRLYALESLSSDHRIYAHFWLTSLVTDLDAAEWRRGVDQIDPSIRDAFIFHPRHFTVGA